MEVCVGAEGNAMAAFINGEKSLLFLNLFFFNLRTEVTVSHSHLRNALMQNLISAFMSRSACFKRQ